MTLSRRQKRLQAKPWITNYILNSITTKQKLHKSHYLSNISAKQSFYKRHTNILTELNEIYNPDQISTIFNNYFGNIRRNLAENFNNYNNNLRFLLFKDKNCKIFCKPKNHSEFWRRPFFFFFFGDHLILGRKKL